MDRQTPPRRLAGLAPPVFLTSVRGRIVFGFALLVLILVTVVAGAAWLAREHRTELEEMERIPGPASALDGAKADGAVGFALLQTYLVSGNEALVPDIEANLEASREHVKLAIAQEEKIGHGDSVQELRELLTVSASLMDTWSRSVERRRAGDVQGAIGLAESTPLGARQLGAGIDAEIEAERGEVEAIRAEANATGKLGFWLLVVSGAVGAALGLGASVFIARSIIRPLSRLGAGGLGGGGGGPRR